MRTKLGFLAGAAVGYVLGAKAGHERYDQIKHAATKFAHSATVQNARSGAQHQATRLYGSTKDKISTKISDTSWIPGRNRSPGSAADFASEVADDAWATATRSH